MAENASAQVTAYPVVELEGSRADLELALAFLLEWGSLGAEEREDGSSLRAYFSPDVDLPALCRRLNETLPSVHSRPGAPERARDWLSEWKKSLVGLSLGERFFVLPTWRPLPDIERSVLRIDPEQAFGTGVHETTRLAASLLERLVRPGSRVIDLGSGTGILAMIAARLGAASVVAVEPDEDAAACARENVSRNQLAPQVRVETKAAEDFETLAADLIVANINRPILESAVPKMESPAIVLSGLLVEELEEFEGAIAPRQSIRERWTSGDWAALVLGAGGTGLRNP